MSVRGARYIHIFVPCPLGWGAASGQTIHLARLAAETGIFPVFEAEFGELTGVRHIRRKEPVEAYLKLQALRAPLRQARESGSHRPHPAHGRPQHSEVRPACGRTRADHPVPEQAEERSHQI